MRPLLSQLEAILRKYRFYTLLALCIFAIFVPRAGLFAQTLTQCECLAISKQGPEEAVQSIVAAYNLTNEELLNNPFRLSPFVRKHIKSIVSSRCTSSGEETINYFENTDLTALISYGQQRYQQCVSAENQRYEREVFGDFASNLVQSLRRDLEGPSYVLENTADANQSIFQEPEFTSVRLPPDLAFLNDILALHEFYSGASTILPDQALFRLAPWAFPEWPSDQGLSDMTISDFVAMLKIPPGAIGNEESGNLGASDSDRWYLLGSSADEFEQASLLTFMRLFEQQDERLCPAPVVNPGLQFDDELAPNNEPLDVPRRVNPFELLRQLGVDLPDGASESYEELESCIARCRSIDYGPGRYCEDQCIFGGANSEAGSVLPEPVRVGNPECDRFNHAYRAACYEELERKHGERLRQCQLRYVYNPNLPDRLDWTELSGPRDCNRYTAQLYDSCMNHFFQTGGPMLQERSLRQAALDNCRQRFCGNRDETSGSANQRELGLGGSLTLSEQREFAAQESERKYREIVTPTVRAIESRGEYKFSFSRQKPKPGSQYPSRSHSYGGAADYAVTRADGEEMTYEDYERVAAQIAEVLSTFDESGNMQVLIEVRMSQVSDFRSRFEDLRLADQGTRAVITRAMGIEGNVSSPGEWAESFDAFRRAIEQLAVSEEVYYKDGLTQERHTWRILSYRASGDHIHIGEPGSLYEHLD